MNCQSIASDCNVVKQQGEGLGLDQSTYSDFKTWVWNGQERREKKDGGLMQEGVGGGRGEETAGAVTPAVLGNLSQEEQAELFSNRVQDEVHASPKETVSVNECLSWTLWGSLFFSFFFFFPVVVVRKWEKRISLHSSLWFDRIVSSSVWRWVCLCNWGNAGWVSSGVPSAV